ncbi:hypothetical protein FE257_005926 [Aspergillus nanangensis]|uniref:Xylanolytic transcriptional activator regulatory domain-containing protein n=1 Tax=Aspergillus nanangensis TaxID=2582783 RepID=A0AAD4CPY5_ASPNN|nr:hypothetical protein FE257_005926 [Aspergillus nanangensis]
MDMDTRHWLSPIPDEVFFEACRIFFLHCHRKPYCLFNAELFHRRRVEHRVPPYLRLAIIASAVRYSRHSQWKEQKQRTIDSYAQCAWSLITSPDALDGTDDVSGIQALALLAIIDATAGRRRAAWVKIGMAVRISQDLYMMLEPDPSLSDEERDERRNLFWSLYLLDRFICCSFERPPAIKDADCLLSLPDRPVTLHQLLDVGLQKDSPRSHLFPLSVGLAALLGRAVDCMMRKEPGVEPWRRQSDYSVIHDRLELLKGLTGEDEMTVVDGKQSTHMVLSRTLYHLIHCILKHPFLLGVKMQAHRSSSVPPVWAGEARTSCLAHASSLTTLLVDAQAAGYMPVPSFYSYCILVAGTVHALHLYGPDSSVSQRSSEYLKISLEYLAQITEFWENAQLMVDILRFFTNRCVRYSNLLLRDEPCIEELTSTDVTVLRSVVDYWTMMDPRNPVADLNSINIDCFPSPPVTDNTFFETASPDPTATVSPHMKSPDGMAGPQDLFMDPKLLFQENTIASPASNDEEDFSNWHWESEINALTS